MRSPISISIGTALFQQGFALMPTTQVLIISLTTISRLRLLSSNDRRTDTLLQSSGSVALITGKFFITRGTSMPELRVRAEPIRVYVHNRYIFIYQSSSSLASLNQKVVTSLFTPQLENATTVVKLNVLRHHIKRIQMENFAQSRSQHIFVFPAQHSQVKCTMLSTVYLEELLQQMDQGSAIPSSGLFLYTQEMPVMVLANICTLLGHVNGTHGIASGIVVNPTGKCFHPSSFCLSLILKNSGVLRD